MKAPSAPTTLSTATAGTLAASLLANACRLDLESQGSFKLEVVQGLAEDLRKQLDALSQTYCKETEAAYFLAESALRCADLANLAACNLSELSEGNRPKAAAAVHLAAGTARALGLLADGESERKEIPRAEHVRRDAWSARWRADITIRQVGEFVGGGRK